MSESGKPPANPTGDNSDITRKFQPIDDPAETLRLIKEGAKTLASTMIWTKDQEQVINSRIAMYSESTHGFYCWIPKDFDLKHFNDTLAEIDKASGESACFFSMSLQRANIFFKAMFLGFDPAGLLFRLPTQVYKVQRRTDLRFPIPDGLTIRVEFTDPLDNKTRLTKKILDVSARGIAFLVTHEEAPIYQPGLALKEMSFTVKNRKITVTAEVRHTRPVSQEKRMKGSLVGVLFKDIRPGDSQHIAGYVFEESRKYFSRYA